MWRLSLLLSALLVPASGPAPASALHEQGPRRPMRLVLVGDSTVADRAGWGRAFRLFCDDTIECVNVAAGGRSSKSYIDEGRWTSALALKGDYYLIQFGHNDEPGKGPERETEPATTYRAYLSRYIADARAIGAKPVLITSLSRRTFKAGKLYSTLTPYVSAVRALASEQHVPLIDLHARSAALIETMGEGAWAEYSPRDAAGAVDRTHLNARGGFLIAPLVVADLRRVVPELAVHITATPLTGAAALRRLSDTVVAADGTGNHLTVQEAVNAAPQNTSVDRPWMIFVRAGTYRELVYVQREKRFLLLVGEDPATTKITYDLQANQTGTDGKPIGTFRTPTVVVDADDFTAENLTFENSAGPVGQALALRVDGDRAVFRNSRFLGWQDTIFLNRGRQYFEDSYVAGHVDFIFGGATAFFERCQIHALRNGYITAASTPPEQQYGFVFARARISGAPGVATYLGRPWRDFAKVTFLDTEMSDVVRAEGWHDWDRPERRKTARFSESGSSGSGASSARRVPWATPLHPEDVQKLTVREVLRGADDWDPQRFPANAPSPTGSPRPPERVQR
jgi:pectinesterase